MPTWRDLWHQRQRWQRGALENIGMYGLLFWVVLGALFAVERTVTVWDGGWRARLIAVLVFVELGYAMFLQAVYVKSLADIATGRSKSWNAAKVTRSVS